MSPNSWLSPEFSAPAHAPYKRVDFGDVDVVEFPDGVFDLVLVGLNVHDEHQRVVVLDLLHGRLGGQRELDDGVVIQPERHHTHVSLVQISSPPCLA